MMALSSQRQRLWAQSLGGADRDRHNRALCAVRGALARHAAPALPHRILVAALERAGTGNEDGLDLCAFIIFFDQCDGSTVGCDRRMHSV